jgi:hypothetical protein
MEANLNEYVWVRLTEDGHLTYLDFYLNLGVEPPSLNVFRGWAKFQIWELMNIFGPDCQHGGRGQFMDNILRFAPPI